MKLAVLAMLLAAAAAQACGDGGLPGAERTGTAEHIAYSASATAADAALPPVTQQNVVDAITLGFSDLNIPYTATTNSSFRKKDLLLGILDDCAKERGHDFAHSDESYWPAVLGDCYTVGDATEWLWEYTDKRAFAYANQLAMRFMRQKFEKAVAAGAGVDEGYWKLVVGKIYTLSIPNTPIAATPLAEKTASP